MVPANLYDKNNQICLNIECTNSCWYLKNKNRTFWKLTLGHILPMKLKSDKLVVDEVAKIFNEFSPEDFSNLANEVMQGKNEDW